MKTSINTIIKKYCYSNNIPIQTLAQKINYTRTATYNLLNRSDMSVNTLVLISQALKHNFFQYIWQNKSAHSKEDFIALNHQINSLKKQIDLLTTENIILKKNNPLSNNKPT